MLKRILLTACFLGATGCQLLTPPDPPYEDPILRPDAFAWDEFDIAQEYEYIDVPRIDCGKVESILSGSGRCVPKHHVIGKLYECPLEKPAEKLLFACLNDENLPSVYVRFEFTSDAENVDFSKTLGECRISGGGPAAGEPARYPTDIGYKACLFTSLTTPGQILKIANTEVPAGVFVDLTDNPAPLAMLENSQVFRAPLALVMDARYLDNDAKTQAFKDLKVIFSAYRALNPELHTPVVETENK